MDFHLRDIVTDHQLPILAFDGDTLYCISDENFMADNPNRPTIIMNVTAVTGRLESIAVEIAGPGEEELETDEAAETNESAVTDEAAETDEPAETGEVAETDEAAETDEPAETGEVAVTDEAAATDDAAETGGAAETDEAVETDEAPETDEAATTDDAAETDEAPETDEAAETGGAAETVEAAETDEAPETDEAATTDDAAETGGAAETVEAAKTDEAPETDEAATTDETAETGGAAEAAETHEAGETEAVTETDEAARTGKAAETDEAADETPSSSAFADPLESEIMGILRSAKLDKSYWMPLPVENQASLDANDSSSKVTEAPCSRKLKRTAHVSHGKNMTDLIRAYAIQNKLPEVVEEPNEWEPESKRMKMDSAEAESLETIPPEDTDDEDNEWDQDSVTTESVSTASLDGSSDFDKSTDEPERVRKSRLKIKFNVYGIFLEMVASDLKKMKRSVQRKFTRDDLIQLGIKIALYMFMNFKKIDSNWPMDLQVYCGITSKKFPNINN